MRRDVFDSLVVRLRTLAGGLLDSIEIGIASFELLGELGQSGLRFLDGS